jgi:type II secretory pathway predicted ATPase ExeA
LVGTRLGNYRLERVIGRGRMGVVYLAKDEALLRPTAIKVLAWSAQDSRGQDPVQWFLAEARLVARINDPRVVQIYGAARHGEYFYIAMEYVPGRSSEAMLEESGRLAPEVATEILLQASSALLAAHRSGVVHRDVKPANLLVGQGGVTKLGDFGMALGAAGVGVGAANVRAGTPFYTAPEIWRGGVAGPPSDIYALGATYFHLLTGRPPFDGPDIPTVEQAHLKAPIPDPGTFVPGLPASCTALIRRALAKAPAERHPSAQDLMWDGRRVMQDLSGFRQAGAPQAPSRQTSGVRAPRLAPPEPAELPPVSGPLKDVLGFERRPFGPVDAANAPYQAEPHASARSCLLQVLSEGDRPVVALTGPRGSGRSTLLRGLAAALASTRLVLSIDVRAAPEGRTLLQRLCNVAGVTEASGDEIRRILDRLDEERRQRQRPLVVLDGVQVPHPSTTGLSAIVGAAVTTRGFQVLLCGEPGLMDALARTGVDLRGQRPAEVALPPLDADQVAHFVRSWLRATRPREAQPVVFSQDALLLLARRSEGVLLRIGTLAENMLVLAAAERRRTVTAWHAWAASDRERWYGRPAAGLPVRPAEWPTREALEALDACRTAAGLPPWPRMEPG